MPTAMMRVVSVIVLIAPLLAEQVIYLRFVEHNREKKQHPVTKKLASYGWAFLWDAAWFAVLGYAAFVIAAGRGRGWHWLGYPVLLTGVSLRCWALVHLGAFYDGGIVIQTGHRVVETGPYRVYRHPLHLGTTLEIVGLAAWSPVWLAVLAVGVSLALTLLKDHHEDRALLSHLGSTYGTYYARTWDVTDLVFPKNDAQ